VTDALAVADRFFTAISAGDIDTVSSIYRDDVAIWHNWDDLEQSKDDNLKTLGSLGERWERFAYTEVRRTAVDGGFLQQHVIAVGRGDRDLRIPAILRVWTEGEQITRIEEYFDRRGMDELLAG
jgi:ketosteroid isomerase-like protein